MNGNSIYLGFEEDLEVDSIRDAVPAVWRCMNLLCSSDKHEYLVSNLDQKNCPTCKRPGDWIRRFLGTKAERYSCGMCKRVIVVADSEFPVGHYGWGFLQLSNRDPFQTICPGCTAKLRIDFPSLATNTSKTKEEVLPKIIQPSKL